MRKLKEKKDFNYRSVIGPIKFLTNSTHPKAQFVVHKCALFSANTKLPHYQAVKLFLKYPKGTDTQELIINPDPENGIK